MKIVGKDKYIDINNGFNIYTYADDIFIGSEKELNKFIEIWEEYVIGERDIKTYSVPFQDGNFIEIFCDNCESLQDEETAKPYSPLSYYIKLNNEDGIETYTDINIWYDFYDPNEWNENITGEEYYKEHKDKFGIDSSGYVEGNPNDIYVFKIFSKTSVKEYLENKKN